MNNKLALLALLPLVAFLAVPVAAATPQSSSSTTTTSSSSTSTYPYPGLTVIVSCEVSAGIQAGASITINGHSYEVLCPFTTGGTEAMSGVYCAPFAAASSFKAWTFAGGLRNNQKGKFGLHYGELSFEQHSAPSEPEAAASWEIASPCAYWVE